MSEAVSEFRGPDDGSECGHDDDDRSSNSCRDPSLASLGDPADLSFGRRPRLRLLPETEESFEGLAGALGVSPGGKGGFLGIIFSTVIWMPFSSSLT